jgi:ribose 5-phosphate isomerase B
LTAEASVAVGGRVAVAADHNGLDLKRQLIAWLTAHGFAFDDRGADGSGPVDYPPLCADVCAEITGGRADRGLIIGGSGMGEHIACNKVRGIRAGLCHSLFTAEISRGNNDANVLIVGAKVVEPDLAEAILERWMSTPFKGGVHRQRLEQIAAMERGEDIRLR